MVNSTKKYITQMKKHEKKIDLIWDQIVSDTNEYLSSNHTWYAMEGQLDSIVEKLTLHGAWLHDRINNKTSIPNVKGYRGSLTKKIRKALGFTF